MDNDKSIFGRWIYTAVPENQLTWCAFVSILTSTFSLAFPIVEFYRIPLIDKIIEINISTCFVAEFYEECRMHNNIVLLQNDLQEYFQSIMKQV